MVNKYGLGLLNPVTSENKKYPILKYASTELIQDVTGKKHFPTRVTFWRSGNKGMADFKICYDVNDAKLKGPVDNLKATDHHLIICAKKRCSWLTVRVITVTGTVLVAM